MTTAHLEVSMRLREGGCPHTVSSSKVLKEASIGDDSPKVDRYLSTLDFGC